MHANRGIVFMMRTWASPSELWLQRMLESLAPDIRHIIARRAPVAHWGPRIPVFSIDREYLEFWERQGARLRLWPATPREFEHWRIERICRQRKVSAVLVHYATWALRYADIWERLGKPVYVHVHGFDTEFEGMRDADPTQRICDDAYPQKLVAMSRYVTFIANSKVTQRRLLGIGVPASRIELKYFGVELPADIKVQSVAEPLVFLFLGRLMEWKGPDLTIQAFERYRERGGLGRLILAGDGPLMQRCSELVEASRYRDSIEMPGVVSRSQGDALRRRSHVFVAHNIRGQRTRREEAFGVSPIEAMAAGLPVLSGRSGGLVETVVEGQTGFLFDPGDIDAQADYMLALERDPALRAKLSAQAREHVRQNFGMEQERARLREILELQ